MKNLYAVLVLLFVGLGSYAQIIQFEDIKFKEYLVGKYDDNDDGEIDQSEIIDVKKLFLTNMGISSLVRLKYFTNLTHLDCSNNNLKSLDVSNNLALTRLDCSNNDLTSLDGSNNEKLEHLDCEQNELTILDVSNNVELEHLSCSRNELTSLDVSNNEELEHLGCVTNELTSLDVSNNLALTNLVCTANLIKSLDVSNNKQLETLRCPDNELDSLDVSNNLALKYLSCGNNKLKKIDVSSNKELESFSCTNSELTDLDVSNNLALTDIFCHNNSLKSLDVSNNKQLKALYCSDNNLISLDVSNNLALTDLDCNDNELTSLDVSSNKNLISLYCENNSLTDLNIKNGIKANKLHFEGNRNLKHICADEIEMLMVQEQIELHEYSDVLVSSYCSFTPGGEFYTVKVKNNNCNEETISIPNLKYEVSDGTTTGLFLSSTKMDTYSIPLSAGDYTVIPKLESPNYYTVEPSSINVSFPSESSPYIQNFCITPIADINDLEITIAPIGIPARPGFDAEYKIIYKNKGTTTLSGNVSLKYMDDVLNYESASVSPSEYNDYELLWGYTDLKPFESKEIKVTFNVNSQQETPAINNGDILSFSAKIYPIEDDKSIKDNTSWLRNTVVGSYDPNDKICLEGTEVLEEMIGEYVHYRIRFENEGTFAAENIVVVDEIDETKFDLSTLTPLDASHDFETRIKENKVEFIFEGIQLPYDAEVPSDTVNTDDNNDGYVIFKIKTLPTLKLGDSFSNQASIYFDFNFPIITNNETTTIVEEHLGVADFEFNQELTLYPNPVQDRLYITSNSDAKVLSIEIYNLQGQLIQSVPEVTKMSFDVSRLSKGTYLVNVHTNKGVGVSKMVKE